MRIQVHCIVNFLVFIVLVSTFLGSGCVMERTVLLFFILRIEINTPWMKGENVALCFDGSFVAALFV